MNKLIATGLLALALGMGFAAYRVAGDADRPPPEVVAIAPGVVRYLPAGQVRAVSLSVAAGFAIMRRQVSQAEYAACVADGGCPPLDGVLRDARAPDLPVVGISWLDATAYARWLSRRSGHVYRLPSYGEWVLAAAEAYRDEPLATADDAADPAQRWLAEYERESRRGATSPELRPFGGHGRNAHGVQDMAGNVWEWTDTCFGQGGRTREPAFCGIRVAAGRHPSGLSDFIRDPVSGACSVGVPPAHLGLRLVREAP